MVIQLKNKVHTLEVELKRCARIRERAGGSEKRGGGNCHYRDPKEIPVFGRRLAILLVSEPEGGRRLLPGEREAQSAGRLRKGWPPPSEDASSENNWQVDWGMLRARQWQTLA